MSKMKSALRPSLLPRPPRVLRSSTNVLPTSPVSLIKSEKPIRIWEMKQTPLQPDYNSISSQLSSLAKMVHEEFGKGKVKEAGNQKSQSTNSSPLFERGRFYNEYSARRNERLKRKKEETGDEGKTPYRLGVAVESVKKRDTKKLQSLRKSCSAAYSVERSEGQVQTRYMLRSNTKENRKPPLAVSYQKSATAERKVGGRTRKT